MFKVLEYQDILHREVITDLVYVLFMVTFQYILHLIAKNELLNSPEDCFSLDCTLQSLGQLFKT